jgi:Ulp1 family protease
VYAQVPDRVAYVVNQHQAHWVSVAVDFVRREGILYDSFGRLTVRAVPEAMANIAVMATRRGVDPDTIRWKSQSEPAQHNGSDCGVFATLFAASFVAPGVFVDFARFRQQHAEYARAWMLCCILSVMRK